MTLTYAILGATGATGSAALGCLLNEPVPNINLNILVRSKPKLLKRFPQLATASTCDRVAIVEGTSTDTLALERCVSRANVIFMCVGQNESVRGMSLTYDTVSAIIETLERLRKVQGIDYKPPTILQLRSASLNPRLSCHVPRPVFWIVSFCLHYSHLDMVEACSLYVMAASKGLLNYVFVDPPTIHDPDGTQPTGYKLVSHEKQSVGLSYADLGVAFCEIARRVDEFRSQAVGVSSTGHVNETWGLLAGYLVKGAQGRLPSISAKKDTQTSFMILCVVLLVATATLGFVSRRGFVERL